MACAAGLLLATVAAFLCRRSVMPHRISSPGSDRLRAEMRASSIRNSSTSELLSTSSCRCWFIEFAVDSLTTYLLRRFTQVKTTRRRFPPRQVADTAAAGRIEEQSNGLLQNRTGRVYPPGHAGSTR